MDENEIRRFWEANPCGDGQAGGLDAERCFRDYDAIRSTCQIEGFAETATRHRANADPNGTRGRLTMTAPR